MGGATSGRSPRAGIARSGRDYELETIDGLEEFAERELRNDFGGTARVTGRPRPGRVALTYPGDPGRLNRLRTAVAVYAVQTFDVPRPKALLGQQNFSRIVAQVTEIMALFPPGTFASVRVSGAGSASPVFQRLKSGLAEQFGLTVAEAQADLHVAVRPAAAPAGDWQVLVRTSPRPLSTRSWRVCDLPGALNATIAHVMDRLAQPRRDERFLNLACGSGTLLIERLALGSLGRAVGVDIDPAALGCAAANLGAAGDTDRAEILQADATCLPFPSAAFDTIVADLPYGMLMGTKRENVEFYPAVLAEAARVATRGARFVVITASKRLLDASIARVEPLWGRAATYPLKVSSRGGYIYPAIFVLQRA